jgi:serine phosphatase RsbU (regulator of sigma subunit)
LQPGDRLVLYTDGLCDLIPAGQHIFDRRQLQALLQANAHLEPDALCEEVFAHLGRLRMDYEQYDDMTLLVMAFEPDHTL